MVSIKGIISSVYILALSSALYESGASAQQQQQVPSWASEFLQLVNGARAQNGAQPVCLTENMMIAATDHSRFLESQGGRLSHTGAGGSSISQRMRRAGVRASSFGENLASDDTSPQNAFTRLMNSPGHRRNILNPSFNIMGLGGLDFGPVHRGVWVQKLAGGADTSECLQGGESLRSPSNNNFSNGNSNSGANRSIRRKRRPSNFGGGCA